MDDSKLIFDTKVQYIKYRVLSEVAKSAYEGDLLESLNEIPKIISPGPDSQMRCCIYKERAIVNERINRAVSGVKKGQNVISVIDIACDECPSDGFEITDDCRGCLAHRCKRACPKGAIITVNGQKATIDKTKCINCGLCAQACPYSAIRNRTRPCMIACKVKAIKTNENGSAMIDDEKCISCGACVYQCPFGAITDRSSIVQIINELKNPENHVYAIIAPAIASQFDYAKLGQVITGIKRLGFYEVMEAALGADMVTYSETQELLEKKFLTSSCCPAFVRYIQKNFPELVNKISHNPSPMIALSKFIKEQDPLAKCVFIGPCTAKKREAVENGDGVTDYVMTFEELQAIFSGREIDLTTLEETKIDNASFFGRIFGRVGGLCDAVREMAKEANVDFEVRPYSCDGIENIKKALTKIKRGGPLDYNFLEGMACLGGCIGGPCNISHEIKDRMQIDNFGKTSTKSTILDSIEAAKK